MIPHREGAITRIEALSDAMLGYFAWLNAELRKPGHNALEATERARIPSANLQGTPPHGIAV